MVPKEIKFISLPGQVLTLRSFVPQASAFPTRKLYAEQFVKASLQHVADTELVTASGGWCRGRYGPDCRTVKGSTTQHRN